MIRAIYPTYRKLLAVTSLLVAGACVDATNQGDANLIPESHWVLTRVETPRGTFDATDLSEQPTLTFGLPEAGATLAVSGFGGCNQFGGLAAVGDTGIAFEQLTWTEIYCPGPRGDVEAEFFDALGAAARYEAQGALLIIETDSGSRLRFVALSL